jgi:hypothetical protein
MTRRQEISGYDDVVAVGEQRRAAGLDLEQFRSAENANLRPRSLDHLRQGVTTKLAVHVLDGDERLTCQHGSAETLLGFFFIAACRDPLKLPLKVRNNKTTIAQIIDKCAEADAIGSRVNQKFPGYINNLMSVADLGEARAGMGASAAQASACC